MELYRAQHITSDFHKEQLGKGFELVNIVDLGFKGITHLKPEERLLRIIAGGDTMLNMEHANFDDASIRKIYLALHPEMQEILVTDMQFTPAIEGTTEPHG